MALRLVTRRLAKPTPSSSAPKPEQHHVSHDPLCVISLVIMLLSSASGAKAWQEPTDERPLIVLPGSRVLTWNHWRSIENRANFYGEKYAIAVRNMRRAIEGGRLQEAYAAFQEAVSLDPARAPYAEWGDALATRGNLQNALAVYRQGLGKTEDRGSSGAAAKESYSATAVMRYCLLLLQTGEKREAAKAYEWGYELTKSTESRFEGLRNLFDLKPVSHTVDAKLLQAAAYTVIGLTNDEARTEAQWAMPPDMTVPEFENALAIKPDFDVARLFLGKAYKGKGYADRRYMNLATQTWEAVTRSKSELIRLKAKELLERERAKQR